MEFIEFDKSIGVTIYANSYFFQALLTLPGNWTLSAFSIIFSICSRLSFLFSAFTVTVQMESNDYTGISNLKVNSH